MITYAKRKYTQFEIESILDSNIKEWFKNKYKTFTPPQKYSIMEIHKGKNVLIASPTGSGKTLSAFMTIINELVDIGRKEGKLENKVYALYISPLKALNNDVKRNLETPLKEIEDVFKNKGLKMPEIRIGIRTGDTKQKEKSKMLRKPPHILITTPESLAILLNSPKFLEYLKNIKWVIVDEVHSLADNKRGTHLSLSLERLQYHNKKEFIRIGLSATVSPLEEVAKYLVGDRSCLIIDVDYRKKIKLDVISPAKDLIYEDAEKVNKNLYKILREIIDSHKTTLIFTNTRNSTERVVHNLKPFYKDKIEAHHSSLSRRLRLSTEERLKNGELKVVVSSTSLELGIDIGEIEVVVLLGSPKSVARTLQRVGRSGHNLKDISKGIFLVLDRDDLIEDVILAHNARNKKIEKIRIIKNALDVLAQHIFGMALNKKWDKNKALKIIRRSYCYKDLKDEDYEETLKYLSGYYGLEENKVYGKIWYDGQNFGKRTKRHIYYLNIGTIPDESHVYVKIKDSGLYVGKIEEAFAEKLVLNDVFALGGENYTYVGGKGNVVYVIKTPEKNPTIPAWFSEMLPLNYEIARDIDKFRRKILNKKEIMKIYKVNEFTAETIINYLKEQKEIVRELGKTLIEIWEDEKVRNIIFHFVIGRKANDAVSKVFAYRLGKKINSNVGILLSDYGFVLQIPLKKKISNKDIFELIEKENFENDLKEAIKNTELFRRRFKHVATRSLMILKNYMGKEISLKRRQYNADILLKILSQKFPNYIVLKETYREILEDAMHMDEAIKFLKEIKKEGIKIRNGFPSPFSFSMLALGSRDIVVLEDRKQFIMKMHKMLMRVINEKNKRKGSNY